MNIDANVQKIITLLIKRWKIIILFALLGTLLAYFYTANFTTLTYSSSVEFLAYAQDTQQELSDSTAAAQQASNTSKMNYAIKMLDTYIELFKTNEFNQTIATDLNDTYNTSYTAGQIKGAVSYEEVNGTSMFKVTVTTTNADMSYQIAKQLETSIPEKMKNTNNSLVMASVEDTALKASASESLGYPKKCLVGFVAGAVLAAAYIILRDLLDVRIRGNDNLSDRYGIPVLGTIPEFELKVSGNKNSKQKGGSK
ncbi:MAG: hypothetical protein J1E36_01010 [Eubacterium sp.]|nr:hypothetical protein [Eubacterium sp.]